MIIPPGIWAAGAAVALALSFSAGWKVRDWRCDAAQAKVERAVVRKRERQQAQIHEQATGYEQEKADATQQTVVREQQIRTIYRTVSVPGECAAPDGVVGVLDDAITAANARAGSQSGAAVRAAAPPSTSAD